MHSLLFSFLVYPSHGLLKCLTPPNLPLSELIASISNALNEERPYNRPTPGKESVFTVTL